MPINNKCVQSSEFWAHVWGFDKNATFDKIPECNICRIVCEGIEEFNCKRGDCSKLVDVNVETHAAHVCQKDIDNNWNATPDKAFTAQWLGCVHCKSSHHIDNYCECGTCFMQAKELHQDKRSGYTFVTCDGCGKKQIWY